MLKRKQFEDSKNDKTELRGSKYQQLYIHDNEEEESLNKFESKNKREDIGYILLLFISFAQKKSNPLTDINTGTKNLNHLLCILKIGYLYNCLFCIKVSRQKMLESQKKLYKLSIRGFKILFGIHSFHKF